MQTGISRRPARAVKDAACPRQPRIVYRDTSFPRGAWRHYLAAAGDRRRQAAEQVEGEPFIPLSLPQSTDRGDQSVFPALEFSCRCQAVQIRNAGVLRLLGELNVAVEQMNQTPQIGNKLFRSFLNQDVVNG